jgi:hypothetical protein
MSLLDLHLDEVLEPSLVQPGEYELKITGAQIVPSKSSSREILKVTCDINEMPGAQPVYLNLSLPLDTDAPNTKYFMKLNLKHFLEAFGLTPSDPGNPPEWRGLTGWGMVVQKENKETGLVSHDVSKWITLKK